MGGRLKAHPTLAVFIIWLYELCIFCQAVLLVLVVFILVKLDNAFWHKIASLAAHNQCEIITN